MKDLPKVKVLITGASGFIGSRLFHALRDDFEVRTVPHDAINQDLTVDIDTSYIFHLATYGNYYDRDNTWEMLTSNVLATNQLLQRTLHIDYKAFINFSSSSVGLARQTFYSVTKHTGEELCKLYAQDYKKPIVSVRPFTVTGVGEQDEHLIPSLIQSCRFGKEMPFVAEPVHDFIDVQDLIDALLIIVAKIEKAKGRIIDVGTGIMYSNAQVKEIVEELTGKRAKIKPLKYMRSYDNQKWCANTKFLNDLGWKPTKTLKQSISAMINQ